MTRYICSGFLRIVYFPIYLTEANYPGEVIKGTWRHLCKSKTFLGNETQNLLHMKVTGV